MNEIKKLYGELNGGKEGLKFKRGAIKVDSYHGEDGKEVVVKADSIYEDEDGNLILSYQDCDVRKLSERDGELLTDIYIALLNGTDGKEVYC